MTLPGVPCIYYGDERGMEGFRDPYRYWMIPASSIGREAFVL